MGSLLNTISSPFGIKLSKGGPYPDGGALDRQQDQAAPMAKVGNDLIQQGSHLPGLQDMGFLQYLPQIFQSLSALTGTPNPLAGGGGGIVGGGGQMGVGPGGNGQAGQNMGAQRNPSSANEMHGELNQSNQSPYALNPVQQSQLNQQNSQTSQDYQRTMARIKANLAARGLTHSSHMDAASAYLKNQMLKQQNTNRAGAQYGAYQNRLDTTNQFGNMLSSIYGQQAQRQSQLLGQGQNLVAPQLQNTGAQAQMAQQNTANSQAQLGSLLGAGFGGMFGKSASPNPFLGGGRQPGSQYSAVPQSSTPYTLGDLPASQLPGVLGSYRWNI